MMGRREWLSVVTVVLLGWGCSGDPGGPDGGSTPVDGSDAVDAADAGDVAEPRDGDAGDAGETTDGDDLDGGDGDGGDAVTAPDFLCNSCTADGECGGSDDECISLAGGEQVCGLGCDLSQKSPCPSGYRCATQEEGAEQGQCVPDELTCRDRCEGVECGEGQVCDPLRGECRERLGLCDTDCTADKVCGDGSDDRCISVPGTESERICATGCNPEADNPSCPVNYQCVATRPDVAPEEGICYPLEGTCVDRCSDVDCGEGSNCNRLTGECEEATYGACERGCQSDAQCGRQEDRCLPIGEAAEPHCLIDCSDSGDTCPSGYTCQQIPNSRKDVCVPENQRCTECQDTDCGPREVCDPTSGECVELSRDCKEVGCPEGEVCAPRDGDCVEIGKSCSGDSWAADCGNNIEVGCTTRRDGTSGQCARICSDDSECADGRSCVDTNLESFCLGADLGGPQTCGTLHDASSDVGAPCDSSFDCGGSADRCVSEGALEGFCSRGCSGDGDCPDGHSCRPGPGGTNICLPPQCACAARPAVGSDAREGLSEALQQVGTDQCELVVDTDEASRLEALRSNPLQSDASRRELSLPLEGHAAARNRADQVGSAASTPQGAVVAGGHLAGESVQPASSSFSFSGSHEKLTQAVADLVTAAGGSPDRAALDSKASAVPSGYQDVAAPIVKAVADAVEARDTALDDAGWKASDRQSAFDAAPYLFLPGTSTQEANAPDLSQSSVRQKYRDFPTGELAQASGTLLRAVTEATSDVSNRSSWTGFTFVADTPAGKVIVGDAEDTVYDPSSNSDYQGDVAVLIDAGGNDTYRMPVGANQSASNGVAVHVDLGGQDTYTYPKVGDSSVDESNLMTSDGDGRKSPSGSLLQGNGPVSLSTTGRQGAARIGIAASLDFGAADDVYESLRMSQGASVFGVGVLYDEGGNDEYDAEALSQGAALGGIAVHWDGGGDDDYRVWHAGQGFGTAGGAGLLAERGGGDRYEGVQGQSNGDGVLYFSLADRGASNRNLAQGASAGVVSTSSEPGLAGGRGMLHDLAGSDRFRAATYAQGYGSVRGLGALVDVAGDDQYLGRAQVQGSGRLFGGGILDDGAGNDVVQQSSTLHQDVLGFGRRYGWGIYVDRGGDDERYFGTLGGGAGRDGGFGIFVDSGGTDVYNMSGSGWGSASNSASSSPVSGAETFGFFVDAGGADDTYDRPNLGGVANDATWLDPDPSTSTEKGAGVDR